MNDPNFPTFAFDQLPLHWQMPRADKFALVSLLENIRPKVSIEVGTYKGGSLQVLSRFSERVHSVDINADSQKKLVALFENVDFHIGDSSRLLPLIMDKAGEDLGFALIDGDHSERGVMADLSALLKIRPKRSLWILCHDSFNPKCRRGMLRTDWAANPHVQFVEIDFVSGVFHQHAFDTARAKSMWGGLCVAHLTPKRRVGELRVRQSQQSLFAAAYLRSRHFWLEPCRLLIQSILRRR